jgi:hypothetical protein
LGSPVSHKDHQQVIIARFDQHGNQIFQFDLQKLLSEVHPLMKKTSSVTSPVGLLSCRTNISLPVSENIEMPYSISKCNLYHNAPLFTPARVLSPTAAAFQMSSPINVPLAVHPVKNTIDSIDECSSVEDNYNQPDRSDTPHSMHSTTSNESSDSGYCGYVESYPCKFFLYAYSKRSFHPFLHLDYYKLNQLNEMLAMQKRNIQKHPMSKVSTSRRTSRFTHQYHHQSLFRSSSPPTPTPMNINLLASYYTQQAHSKKASMPVVGSHKCNY